MIPGKAEATPLSSRQSPAAHRKDLNNRLPSRLALSGPEVLAVEAQELCAGQGEMNLFLRKDWESGLAPWTVDRHDIANPDTFDTPDWAVVENLPDSRPGMAAFVANPDDIDCDTDDETGALTLISPVIQIPEGTLVPRISINHWIATEFGFDGGNLKIKINDGEWTLLPKAQFDINPYNATLLPAVDGNSNPLAGEEAFTGADLDQSGSWGQSRVTLYGLVEAGDSIQLKFDFGMDVCDGLVGWYVDDVEFYSCSAELPPSDCGNGVIDPGEQCDDGNTFIEDGCSNTCQIDEGWICSDPTAPGVIPDASFEAGTPNPFWDESSTNFGSPICDEASCTTGAGSGPADGLFWAWFGGIEQFEESSLFQSVVIPASSTQLTFQLEVSNCDSPADFLEVLIDGNREFLVDGASPLCGRLGYTSQSIDISAYADGQAHTLEFHSRSSALNQDVSNFFVDDLSLPGQASVCSPYKPRLTLVKEVINDNGGTADASDWVLTADGPTTLSGDGPMVTSGTGFPAGTYNLSESGGPAGYTAGNWICQGGSQSETHSITLAAGDMATCTITNNDINPEPLIFRDGFESD